MNLDIFYRKPDLVSSAMEHFYYNNRLFIIFNKILDYVISRDNYPVSCTNSRLYEIIGKGFERSEESQVIDYCSNIGLVNIIADRNSNAIRSNKFFKQSVSFEGIYPGATDLDFVMEIHNKELIIGELKFFKKQVPEAQLKAITRILTNQKKAGIRTLGLIIHHTSTDPNEVIKIAECSVYRYLNSDSTTNHWEVPVNQITVKELIELWSNIYGKRN
jgi:hypothetical protein